MGKSANQKLKLLYLLDILKENTDEKNIITMQEIIEKLGANGIRAERKSIYDDIEALRFFGYDIVMRKNPTGYYIASREFELPELKTLVAAVSSSNFLSEKKSKQLIKKLEKLTSRHEAKQLQRQVYVADRVKTINENIYYNVDAIHVAISGNVKLKFQYLFWNEKKQLVPKKNGAYYIVSPINLVWSDENYYLVAYSDSDDKVKHYRVDKMKEICAINEKNSISNYKNEFNLAKFSKSTFGMYGGQEATVGIEFSKSMIGVMLDRFGTDIPVISLKNGNFKTNVNVVKSNQFFGWLTGLGENVKLIEPKSIIEEYRKYLLGVLKNY